MNGQALALAMVLVMSFASRDEGWRKKSPIDRGDNNTNLYVAANGNDANDGSASRPWGSIQHAADLAVPGTTIHVAPGTYAENPKTVISGTATARIAFLSERKWGAKIIGSSDSVWTNNGDYVDIQGFEITSAGRSTRNGILNLGSNVRIIANHVHEIPAPGCLDSGGAGIHNGMFPAHDNDVIANVVHEIGNVFVSCNKVHGIYQANLRGRIWNNIVYRAQGWGIHLWHAASNVVIVNNTVLNNGYGGITVGAGDSPGGVVDDYTIVANNIVYQNGRGLLEFGATGTHNLYLNNLVYRNTNFEIGLNNGNTAVSTVAANPLFIDYRPIGGDYHLSSASPAIDAGTQLDAPKKDADGGSRPVGHNWDIGAYEFGTKPTEWPWIWTTDDAHEFGSE